MSWVSHDLEPYVIQRYMGKKVAFVPAAHRVVRAGSRDEVVRLRRRRVRARVQGRRSGTVPSRLPWRGVHAHAVLRHRRRRHSSTSIWRNKLWALSFLIGQWVHAFTDVCDKLGVMLAFPFSTHIYSIGLWPYAAEAGRLGDAAAYFSGPALVWDGLWVVLAIASWRVLTKQYFREVIAPTDPFWGWAGRRLPEVAQLALYRTSFFYGIARWITWILWVHVVNAYAFDLSWGGPHWQPGITNRELNGGGTSWQLLLAAMAVTLTCLLTYLRISGHGPTSALRRRLVRAWARR